MVFCCVRQTVDDLLEAMVACFTQLLKLVNPLSMATEPRTVHGPHKIVCKLFTIKVDSHKRKCSYHVVDVDHV